MGGIGPAVAVVVGELDVPPPVTVGVDEADAAAKPAVRQPVAVGVEQSVVGLPVTVQVDEPPYSMSGPPLCSTPSSPNHRSWPPRSTLTAQVPDPSSVK